MTDIVERLRETAEHLTNGAIEISMLVEAASYRIQKLEKALERYGMHDVDCNVDYNETKCSCGLNAALKEERK
jgi:hypothetical protein